MTGAEFRSWGAYGVWKENQKAIEEFRKAARHGDNRRPIHKGYS